MKYLAFTSMDSKYYEKCGRTMLRSFKKHWVDLMPLYVYNEDDFDVKVRAVKPVGWDLGQDYENFIERHSNDKVKTFAKKGFSIIDAMERYSNEYDRLIWLDADTVIFARMPLQLLDLIIPESVLSAHFSVWHEANGEMYHSCETGFFVLNTTHPGYDEFCKTYKDIYINDKDSDLRRFYDGEVYGKTVEIMEKKGHTMLNLNPSRRKTPIGRSILAPYITHYKAGLKDKIDFDSIEQENEF